MSQDIDLNVLLNRFYRSFELYTVVAQLLKYLASVPQIMSSNPVFVHVN